MTSEKAATRRRYSAQFKVQVLAECDAPGASVARVAMSHGINANLVHGWRKLARFGAAMPTHVAREFVPVTLQPAAMPGSVGPGIAVEVQRGAVTMRLTWPTSAAADFAAWSRELLR